MNTSKSKPVDYRNNKRNTNELEIYENKII